MQYLHHVQIQRRVWLLNALNSIDNGLGHSVGYHWRDLRGTHTHTHTHTHTEAT